MSLPQEIMHQILSSLPTKYLCSLLSTSKAIYLDVAGILHSRLEACLHEGGDHKLIVPTLPRPPLSARPLDLQ
jgi:F-box domain